MVATFRDKRHNPHVPQPPTDPHVWKRTLEKSQTNATNDTSKTTHISTFEKAEWRKVKQVKNKYNPQPPTDLQSPLADISSLIDLLLFSHGGTHICNHLPRNCHHFLLRLHLLYFWKVIVSSTSSRLVSFSRASLTVKITVKLARLFLRYELEKALRAV